MKYHCWNTFLLLHQLARTIVSRAVYDPMAACGAYPVWSWLHLAEGSLGTSRLKASLKSRSSLASNCGTPPGFEAPKLSQTASELAARSGRHHRTDDSLVQRLVCQVLKLQLELFEVAVSAQ